MLQPHITPFQLLLQRIILALEPYCTACAPSTLNKRAVCCPAAASSASSGAMLHGVGTGSHVACQSSSHNDADSESLKLKALAEAITCSQQKSRAIVSAKVNNAGNIARTKECSECGSCYGRRCNGFLPHEAEIGIQLLLQLRLDLQVCSCSCVDCSPECTHVGEPPAILIIVVRVESHPNHVLYCSHRAVLDIQHAAWGPRLHPTHVLYCLHRAVLDIQHTLPGASWPFI